MVGRDVQGVEIVVFVFHFGAVQHGEAKRAEELFKLALDARDGVQVAAPRTGRGQRQVEPFGVEAGFQGDLGEGLLAGFERLLDILPGAIEQLTDARAVFGGELAHFLAGLRQRRFAAERVHAGSLEFLLRGGCGDTRQRTGFQLLYGLIQHVV